MSKEIQSALTRLREAAVNLKRVGGVGPQREQHSHMEYVIDAQNALLEAMAAKLLAMAACAPDRADTFVDTSGNGTAAVHVDGKLVDKFETRDGARVDPKARKLASAK